LGSLPGAVVGGLILGVCESFFGLLLESQMALIIPLLIVIAFLIFKPKGLFGHE
jgi:branched-chain amino acid transport system permease protein